VVPAFLLQKLRVGTHAPLCCNEVASVFTHIISESRTLESIIVSVGKELKQIDSATSELNLLNVHGERPIFEEENVNSYVEGVLALHLSLMHLVQSHQVVPNADTSTCRLLLDHCRNILTLLQSQSSVSTDSLVEISRENKVLPLLHCLIIASASAIYVSAASESLQLQALAREVFASSTLTQPLIREALNVLATASPGDKDTSRSITQSCFLIVDSSS
jgi:hypothetical protein